MSLQRGFNSVWIAKKGRKYTIISKTEAQIAEGQAVMLSVYDCY